MLQNTNTHTHTQPKFCNYKTSNLSTLSKIKKNKQKQKCISLFQNHVYFHVYILGFSVWSQMLGSHSIYSCCPVCLQELENRYIAMKNSCEEVGKEVVQLRQEVKTLSESMETQHKHINKEQNELEKLKDLVGSSEVSKTC